MIGEQYDLFGGVPPHVAGSDTSQEAAEAIKPSVGRLKREVFAVVKRSGSIGITCDAIEADTAMRHQSCSARVRELVLEGRIHDSGERRKTRSGRAARVYVCTEGASE